MKSSDVSILAVQLEHSRQRRRCGNAVVMENTRVGSCLPHPLENHLRERWFPTLPHRLLLIERIYLFMIRDMATFVLLLFWFSYYILVYAAQALSRHYSTFQVHSTLA